MKVVIRYFLFYLSATLFFITYNYLLDLLFYQIDYGNTNNVTSALGYFGYYLVIYSPLFLPFLIFYNYMVNVFLINQHRWIRYGTAMILGVLIGLMIGRRGISFYIGSYRPLKNTILFGLIMLSLEVSRDIILYVRSRKQWP